MSESERAEVPISQRWFCTVHRNLMETGQAECPTGKALRILDCKPHYLTVGSPVSERSNNS